MGDDGVAETVQGIGGLTVYSQEAILGRMLAAMKEILGFGFACELRGVPLRGNGVDYRLRITTPERPVATLQAIAAMHSLVFHIAQEEEGTHLELVPSKA